MASFKARESFYTPRSKMRFSSTSENGSVGVHWVRPWNTKSIETHLYGLYRFSDQYRYTLWQAIHEGKEVVGAATSYQRWPWTACHEVKLPIKNMDQCCKYHFRAEDPTEINVLSLTLMGKTSILTNFAFGDLWPNVNLNITLASSLEILRFTYGTHLTWMKTINKKKIIACHRLIDRHCR